MVSYGDKKTTNNTLEREQALLALKEHLLLAQERMKKAADTKSGEVLFEKGDLVFHTK